MRKPASLLFNLVTPARTAVLAVMLAATAGGAPRAAEVDIRMMNHATDGMMGFDPQLVTIAPGDTVHFVATDKGHDAESIPGMIPVGANPFAAGIGQDLKVTFTVPGVYGYRCGPHGSLGMVGLIVVGNPVNEAAAKQVSVPGMANRTFAKLFQALDARRTAQN
ncbi:MAG: pseudoazurin [Rhizomicrobium sp.]|jgi:pseudoazurin